MADQLYLSLWFPNFRLASLPGSLSCVLQQFAAVAADGVKDSPLSRVQAASAYPISWTEAPVYQRIYVLQNRTAAIDLDRARDTPDLRGSAIAPAVQELTDPLHDDMAYEVEMRWELWTPETGVMPGGEAQFDTVWRKQLARVRVLGFGPDFDNGSYEQNGHVRVDFGLDSPWTLGETDGDDETLPVPESGEYIRQNVEKLLAFTLLVEKYCGISSRLLWTESGEPLAEKLVARLQRVN